MANARDIFENFIKATLIELLNSSFKDERWIKDAFTKYIDNFNQLVQLDQQYQDLCAHQSNLLKTVFEDNRKKLETQFHACLNGYMDSIDILMSEPQKMTSLPSVNQLFRTFHQRINNQIHDYVYNPNVDGPDTKKWVGNNNQNLFQPLITAPIQTRIKAKIHPGYPLSIAVLAVGMYYASTLAEVITDASYSDSPGGAPLLPLVIAAGLLSQIRLQPVRNTIEYACNNTYQLFRYLSGHNQNNDTQFVEAAKLKLKSN